MDNGPPYFGMDEELENPLITTSKLPGAMGYPSTTQALFALIVMIIVLFFILVYCCWGTFSCSRLEDSTNHAEDGGVVVREIQGPGGRGNRMVIVPFSNMIYVGDPESRRIYEIPVEQDKPPAYTEVYDNVPPPPYSTERQGRDTPSTGNSNNVSDTRRSTTDLPPSYEDCLTTTPNDEKWPEVFKALVEQAKREREHPPSQGAEERLVTQLPAVRMPSALLAQNYMLNTDRSTSSYHTTNTPPQNLNQASENHSLQSPPHLSPEEEPTSEPYIRNLLDVWSAQAIPPSLINALNISDEERSAVWETDSSEDQESVTTDESVLISPSTMISATSDNAVLNVNLENNSSPSNNQSSHSTQDYSSV
ncbi:hypothetical protein SK128_000673 [Halocaridina rubra]|uniref:Uncharacterized protein n=1 Tax=Halocaridina rubra TaxID=373956 RepID=A0AAN8X5Y5_HALRR